jgi:hypothetical protein
MVPGEDNAMLRHLFRRDEQIDAPRWEQDRVIRVRGIEAAQNLAKTDAEKFVIELLVAAKELALDELVSRLASFLYRRELTIGGWALDLGVLGSSLFVSEARRELELGKGILWEIDPARKDSDELLSDLSRHDPTALPGDRWRSGGGAQSRGAAGSRGGGHGA